MAVVDSFCMLSILDWEDFGEGGLVTPAFWFTDLHSRVLAQLRLEPPISTQSAFVADSLDRDPSFEIYEDMRNVENDPLFVKRVYVQKIH